MSTPTSSRGVVVGTDGSESAAAAVRWAAQEAAMRDLVLTVVHVVAPVQGPASTLVWPAGQVAEEVLEISENEARQILADAVALAEDSIAGDDRPTIRGELHFGSAVPTLVEESEDAHLVVVGCRGRSGRHRRLLGSVSSGLIHHAHCPVAVVHDEGAAGEGTAGRPVLVGIDGSSVSQAATALAFDEASRRGVDLTALHVWSDTDMSTVPGVDASDVQCAADTTLAESLAGWQEQYPDVKVHRIVALENPARRLLEEADKVQLVVVGSHGRGGFAGMLLGSVSTAVAQEANVPVIVTRRR